MTPSLRIEFTATQARGASTQHFHTRNQGDQGTMNKHRIGALVAAATLTLTFAGTAFAATDSWQGNGYPVKSDCNESEAGTALWIWTGDSRT